MSEQQAYWDRQRQFIHPFVSFLVSGMVQIRDIINDRRMMDAAVNMEQFLMYLDPELLTNLKNEKMRLKRMREGKEQISKDTIFEVLEKIMRELHTAGYFAGARLKTIELGGEPRT